MGCEASVEIPNRANLPEEEFPPLWAEKKGVTRTLLQVPRFHMEHASGTLFITTGGMKRIPFMAMECKGKRGGMTLKSDAGVAIAHCQRRPQPLSGRNQFHIFKMHQPLYPGQAPFRKQNENLFLYAIAQGEGGCTTVKKINGIEPSLRVRRTNLGSGDLYTGTDIRHSHSIGSWVLQKQGIKLVDVDALAANDTGLLVCLIFIAELLEKDSDLKENAVF